MAIHAYFYNHPHQTILQLNPTLSQSETTTSSHIEEAEKPKAKLSYSSVAPEIRGSRGTRHDAVSPIVVVRGVYTGVRRRFQGIRYCGRNTEQRSRLFRGLNTHTPPPVGGVYRLRASPTTYPSTDTRYQGTLVALRRTERISRANSRSTIFHVLIFPPPSSASHPTSPMRNVDLVSSR